MKKKYDKYTHLETALHEEGRKADKCFCSCFNLSPNFITYLYLFKDMNNLKLSAFYSMIASKPVLLCHFV